MFLIFINELIVVHEQYNIKIKLFADDVKLHMRVLNDIDNIKLQPIQCAFKRFSRVGQFMTTHYFHWKALIMSICNVNFTSNFNIDGNTLLPVTSYRDLGVVMIHNLFTSTHIDLKVVKAHQRVNLIYRSFVSHNTSLLVRANLVYIWPLLEYNSVIWPPCLK